MTNARSIAVAQTIPHRGDVGANVVEHVGLIRVAAEEGAGILVFPELSLTGYELDLAIDLAFSREDPRLGPLVDAASSCSMALIVGAPVRIGPRYHIGAFILYPNRTVDLYTKHQLGAFSAAASCDGIVPPAEATVFQPGDSNPLVRFAGWTGAVAVCADIGSPLHAERAAHRGADTYLASMFVIPSELQRDTAALQAYAARHSMAVGFANFGGPSGGLASGGRSAIWSDRGELLVQLEASGSGVAVAVESEAGWRAWARMSGTA